MSKHTPGPWENNGGRIEAGHAGTSEAVVIATVGTVNEQSPTDTLNARLIAVAPGLLAALANLAAEYGIDSSTLQLLAPRQREAWEQARDAIAKAEKGN